MQFVKGLRAGWFYLEGRRLPNPGLESESTRNNIHLNNKQKQEISNKNTRKITCKYGHPV